VFTPPQAAVITGLSLKAVQKAIDEHFVPVKIVRRGKHKRRYLSEKALVCLHLESAVLSLFPPATRKRLFAQILQSPKKKRLQPAAVVTVNLQPSRQAVAKAVKLLRRSESMVSEDANVMSGLPVLRGTRVPVHQIALEIENGANIDEILTDYPTITREQAKMATMYANAHPRTGRPPAQPWRGAPPAKIIRFTIPGLHPGDRKRA